MGIWINGVDVSKSPFGGRVEWNGQLGEIFHTWNEPVELGDSGLDSGREGKNRTDADFKVWSITGGLPVVPDKGSGGYERQATDDDKERLCSGVKKHGLI